MSIGVSGVNFLGRSNPKLCRSKTESWIGKEAAGTLRIEAEDTRLREYEPEVPGRSG